MDLQKFVDAMSESAGRERANYHLTYGDLIDALKAAPEDAPLDKRVVGLGSYRGYYIDIALYTSDEGYTASDTDADPDFDNYDAWTKKHSVYSTELPRKAHELAGALEKLLGNYFTGYKGGEYEITRDKPLWLAADSGDCSEDAVMGISEDLKLVTKVLED